MSRKAIAVVVLVLAALLIAFAAWQWPRTPALVVSLRSLPEVASVEYAGPADAALTLIHLRDWHYVPREWCRRDWIDFDENNAIVSKVQDDELPIARQLIREHGALEVFSEGLSDETDLLVRLDLLRTLAEAEKVGALDDEGRRRQRELTLEVGTPGRLLLAGEIAKVHPVEDADALKAAGWGADASKIEARRRAMVGRLPKQGIALLVLGGSHNLGPHLHGVLYVRVTPRSYPED